MNNQTVAEALQRREADASELDELDMLRHKYLVFRLGTEEYALEAKHVSEIVGMQTITVVPKLARHIRGVINLRGKIIPALDARLRFGLEERQYNERTCIVITQQEEYGATGLIVDAVVEVADIREDAVSPPPKTVKGTRSRYIQGVARNGDKVRMILGLLAMLDDREQNPQPVAPENSA